MAAPMAKEQLLKQSLQAKELRTLYLSPRIQFLSLVKATCFCMELLEFGSSSCMGMVQDFAALDGLLAKDRMSFGDFEDELIHLETWRHVLNNHLL
ncbi:hypothetical protein ZEAMMB73_Zm00001d050083 [Zea mays]|uniref:Uncharacterized protein n=1 Tax=Zea mays TaxID=4577 RepID=A0A1D6PZP1_MAIZE|nr:hypothetical protein ZEAMMB73_Zm00001d050083 [Zea mays]